MRGRSRPPAWYEAILERRGRSAHLEDLARWSRPLRGMAVECLDVQLVLEFLGADGVLGRVKWMHFTLGTEHRPIQTGADRGRARNETRPLVGGLMGRTLPRARVDVGLSTPCPQRLLGRRGSAPWTRRGQPRQRCRLAPMTAPPRTAPSMRHSPRSVLGVAAGSDCDVACHITRGAAQASSGTSPR